MTTQTQAGQTRRKPRTHIDSHLDDIIELIQWGEHPDMVAHRAGYPTRQSLYRRLYRAGRKDLIATLNTRLVDT